MDAEKTVEVSKCPAVCGTKHDGGKPKIHLIPFGPLKAFMGLERRAKERPGNGDVAFGSCGLERDYVDLSGGQAEGRVGRRVNCSAVSNG